MHGVTVQEMWWFFEIILHLGQDKSDKVEYYWSTVDQYFTAFYCNILKQDRLYRVLRFLHFSDSKNEHDKTDENSTGCGKSELCLTSWVIHMLNITLWQTI
jgi:hypothetical protein